MIFIKKKIKLLVFAVAFVTISFIVVLYATGDTLTTGWNFLETGGIYVNGMPVGSEVLLNSKSEGKTSFFQRNVLIKNLRPGTYKVLVKRDGYNSWTKTVKVLGNIVSDADVFILPQKPEFREVTFYVSTTTKVKNQEYSDISSVFASSTKKVYPKNIISTTTIDLKSNLGIKSAPIMNGKLGIWKEGSQIFAGWFGREDFEPKFFCNQLNCQPSLLVYTLQSEPSKIAFFPGREDVVLAVWGGDIFAVQISENNEKPAQFIYHGTKPDFAIIDGSLYIKDKSYIAEVVLE